MVKNVLIVDDDREMLRALKEGFDKFNETFAIRTAEDGLIALEMLKKLDISLVVTDLKMPGMDGFALLAHIMEIYPDIPVIIITGYSTPEMERLAMEGGAVGYISKPFMIENLARQIMMTLRKESDGGTLHSVSSGMFLQLMEMEQKTCTIRLENKITGRKGVLFFREGELLDARVGDSQGKEAAYEIFAWDKVTISIQNDCAAMENRIRSDLQALILDAMRLKDENEEPETEEADKTEESVVEELPEKKSEEINFTERIRAKLEKRIGQKSGLEDVYQDTAWDGLIAQMNRVGNFFNIGRFKTGFVDRGETNDYILMPGKKTTVFLVNPKSPRDKLIEVLASR